MVLRPERTRSPRGYLVNFGITAGLLGGLTLILVLVVLPRRYVLHAGLRESGTTFPTGELPFTPPSEMREEARSLPPPPPPPPVRGPSEIFWSRVEPHLAQGGNPSRALPIFREYLESYPEDWAVWREYAITLGRVGRSAEAVPIWRDLLSRDADPGLRLLLARTLRDLGRWEDASAEYAILSEQSPEDLELALEWARALAWGGEHDRASEVLTAALAHSPGAGDLRLELARAYYSSGRLHDAASLLAELEEEGALESVEAEELQASVLAALAPPEVVDSMPLTPLERAEQALAEEEFQLAAGFYREALSSAPADSMALRGYADVLQYRLEDLEGAREALLRLEELGADDPSFRFRMAQLDVWTGRTEEAEARLTTLAESFSDLPPPPTSSDSTGFGVREVAEVQALLGDISRWRWDPVRSAEAYESALEADSLNVRAQQGLAELEVGVTERVAEEEDPGIGGAAYSIEDSDDFTRLDLGLASRGTRGIWAWNVLAGTRWLGGVDLQGRSSEEQGSFLEVETARWWKWGTFRTGLELGVEDLGPSGAELSLGASLRWPSLAGFRSDLRFEHGPAYSLTTTLQSLYGEAVQDRLTATFAREFGGRWSLSVAADATRVKTGRGPWGDGGDGSFRAESGVSLGRSVLPGLTMGVNARVLTYTAASPRVEDLALFWDPRGLASGGLFAQWRGEFSGAWELRGRFSPALAFIDERRIEGWERVPHISAEAGVSYRGSRLQTNLDGFYYTGRFDGYRAYGARLSFSFVPGGSEGRTP